MKIVPILIQCPSCQAKLKAPDQAAGRKVKCGKCGEPIAVPAGGAEPPPMPPPRPAAAPPEKRKAPAQGALPRRSFDDLKVPKKLRKTFEEEVGEEPILWLGRPTPESYRSKSWIAMWAGLVICILVGVGTAIALMNVEGTTNILIVGGIAGTALLMIGLPLASMPIWITWLMNYRDCYVLTPTRAIVFDNEQIVQAHAKSFTADELGNREVQVNEDGTGSIVFGTEVIDLGERTSRKTKDKKRHGKKVRVTYIKTKREKATKGVGFLDIEDVEAVETLLRQTLELPPPGSQEVE